MNDHRFPSHILQTQYDWSRLPRELLIKGPKYRLQAKSDHGNQEP